MTEPPISMLEPPSVKVPELELREMVGASLALVICSSSLVLSTSRKPSELEIKASILYVVPASNLLLSGI